MKTQYPLALLLLVTSIASAADYHISPGGNDSNPGSPGRPWASFSKAAQMLGPGDTLLVAAGSYREPIAFTSLKGAAGRPIRFVAETGAVLDGTRSIEAQWTRGENGIWSAKLDYDIWQFFAGDQLVYLARWPDARFEDHSIWRMTRCTRSADGGYNKKTGQYFGKCKAGLIYDAPFKSHAGKPGFHEGGSRYEVSPGQESLAESGKDFTGAIAVLNIGHWLTWARKIVEHGRGSDHFRFEPGEKMSLQRFFAWYVLGLEALDRPNEWWFDSETKTVYFIPPDGQDPNSMDLRGKVRDFVVRLDGCTHLSFENLDCFGAGFFIRESSHLSFEDCRFLYPATHKWVLGRFAWFSRWNPRNNPNQMPSLVGGTGNRFVNCTFSYSNAPIHFGGENVLVENCLFHDIEWDLNSNGASGSVMIGKNGVFRRNTLTRTGNSEGVRPVETGTRIELNRIFDAGNLQHDGAAVNVGTATHFEAVVTKNWAHDCNRQGIRFDYHGTGIYRPDGLIHGDGVYLRNVTWNTQPNQVKGDRHLVLNNTIVNVNRYPDPAAEEMTMSVQGFKCMHEIDGNQESLTRNNLANLSHRSWNLKGTRPVGAYVLPGVADHNVTERGAACKYLRDPTNYDFRPAPGSPLVDAGKTVAPEDIKSPVARFKRLQFVGRAPDIGAYEHGDRRYWIPGQQEPAASTPIPKDGAADVPVDCDLIFLEAYRASRHTVYFGTSPDDLKPIARLTDDSTNIVSPGNLEPNATYYWRVDAVDRLGNTTASPVWSFTTRTNEQIR